MITIEMPAVTNGVVVATTVNRGWTVGELAQRAADKIVYVGDRSDPVVQAQARAFKDQIRQVVEHYLREAVDQDRQTTALRLSEAGHPELVPLLGK
jgi:hypothetical protein